MKRNEIIEAIEPFALCEDNPLDLQDMPASIAVSGNALIAARLLYCRLMAGEEVDA